MEIKTCFSTNDILFLCAGSLFIILSIISFSNSKIKLSLLFLVLGAFTYRLLMCFIDPFINTWDEEFHALVARNMMSNPFIPMLYKNPVLPYDYTNWTVNHIWLHKQPLFLWQMALSMKIFGISPFAVRFPSVILYVLIVPMVYRIGKIIFNIRTGYIAALLISVSYIHIDIISGFLNTDQNDAVFICYITFSFWTWTEYMYSGKKYWLILTGLFSGMAVLVKWLAGLIVYAGWTIALLFSKERRAKLGYWLDLLLSSAITFSIFFPWQLYTLYKWPLESKEPTMSNLLHFTNQHDHPGPWWYHFAVFEDQFGLPFIILFLISMLMLMSSKISRNFKVAFLFNIVFVFVFFSFIPVRMPFFCLIVSPLIIIIAAFGIEKFFQVGEKYFTRYSKQLFIVVMIVISFIMLNYDRMEFIHKDRNKSDFYRHAKVHNRMAFNEADTLLGKKDYVVFNCPTWNAVAFMFYTGKTAYDNVPSEDQYNELKNKKIPMAVFSDTRLPIYLTNDTSIKKLPMVLIRNGF
jgi:4-amino-4-deoxy-L-arabinose transferase-like glycosyltransferase